MNLLQKINEDLTQALKSGDQTKLGVLRMAVSAIHNRQIDKKGKGEAPELTDEEVLDVLRKESKKRKEAIDLYVKGGRKDLADKETAELAIIEVYLPAMMNEADVKKIIEEVASKMSGAEFGKIMGEAMKQLKGKADAAAVSRMIKEILN